MNNYEEFFSEDIKNKDWVPQYESPEYDATKKLFLKFDENQVILPAALIYCLRAS